MLPNGVILAGASTESRRGDEKRLRQCWIDYSEDGGRTWQRHGPIPFNGGIAEPSLWIGDDMRVNMLVCAETEPPLALTYHTYTSDKVLIVVFVKYFHPLDIVHFFWLSSFPLPIFYSFPPSICDFPTIQHRAAEDITTYGTAVLR
jgi:hypothetical protein